ncbi:response regulator [Oceanobacillus damuensis]|uniref:response regulator n=1 Tax=Oceanobacillus damuensis TaxID=937928 RepID=UPI000A038DCA|nr:response regulator transcription factor [Oceanobacillus damuensis]
MIKVLLVEDQHLFRDGVESILEHTDDIQVIGAADNGEIAIKEISHKNPDVVLMDIHMPDMDGIKTTKFIKDNYPDMKVVLLTSTAEDDQVITGINFGADGFLIKALYADQLVDSIRMAYRGEVVFSGEVARLLAKRIRELTMDKKQIFAMGLERMGYKFSRREIDIAYLLMENYTNQQIAKKLFLGEGTVKNYISEIYNKLDIHNRTKAVAYFNHIFQKKD